MFKKFLILAITLISVSFVYAEDQIIITTYYPSPYGSYNELTSNSMKIGENYSQPATPFVANGLIVEGNVGFGTTNPTSPAPNGQATGNLDVNDVWLRSVNRWASQQGGITGNSASMNLPAGNYTVLCWGTYFTCIDRITSLLLDGNSVKSFTGFNGDTQGCDQNTIMVKLTVGGGAHTWSFSRGGQWDFMWMAFSQ